MKFNNLVKFILAAALLIIGSESYAQVTIGGDKAPEAFSVLEIISNQQRGLRMPHLTTEQREALTKSSEFDKLKTTLAKGLTIYNIDTDCLEFWNGAKWILMCDDCTPVQAGSITPASTTLNGGQSQMFSAIGFTNVTGYQWYLNNSPVQGQTSANYTYTAGSGKSAEIYVVAYGCNNSSMQSNIATVTITPACTPVQAGYITPAGATLTVGESQVFTASGFTNATGYQWYLNGSPVSGQTSSTYNYTATSGTSATIYVVAYGCNGSSVASNTATVTITPACTPVQAGYITPAGATLTVGESQVFTASGFANATSYQWYVNNVAVSGQTSSTYNYTAGSGTSATIYVIAYGCNGSSMQSNTATVTITPACTPVTSVSIGGTTAYTEGGTISLTANITPSNATAVSYQWYKDGAPITGATGTTYTKASCTTSDAGNYMVLVSNDCSTKFSSPVSVTVAAACRPVTSVSIGGTTAYTEGGTISLTANITPSNATAVSYQWYKDGAPIAGATGTTYTKASCTTSDAGNYMVLVSNDCSTELSSPVSLTVAAACRPVTSVSISGTANYTEGGTISLTANITPANATAVTYYWYKNGVVISGATGATYTKASCTSSDTGNYTVMVKNDCSGLVISPEKSITVTAACTPVTSVSISGTTNYTVGGTISLTANITPSNATAVSYQWRKNGTTISGATGATYTKASCTSSDAGNYTVSVSNSCSNITSSAKSITVTAPTCELGGAKIQRLIYGRENYNDPIRPLTTRESDQYDGTAEFRVTGLPAGATVIGWRILENGAEIDNSSTSGNSYKWKPEKATSSSHPIRVIATIKCTNGETSDLPLETSYGTKCPGTHMWTYDPHAYMLYPSQSGYFGCSGNIYTGWSEIGRGCLVGYVFNVSEQGCRPVK